MIYFFSFFLLFDQMSINNSLYSLFRTKKNFYNRFVLLFPKSYNFSDKFLYLLFSFIFLLIFFWFFNYRLNIIFFFLKSFTSKKYSTLRKEIKILEHYKLLIYIFLLFCFEVDIRFASEQRLNGNKKCCVWYIPKENKKYWNKEFVKRKSWVSLHSIGVCLVFSSNVGVFCYVTLLV